MKLFVRLLGLLGLIVVGVLGVFFVWFILITACVQNDPSQCGGDSLTQAVRYIVQAGVKMYLAIR